MTQTALSAASYAALIRAVHAHALDIDQNAIDEVLLEAGHPLRLGELFDKLLNQVSAGSPLWGEIEALEFADATLTIRDLLWTPHDNSEPFRLTEKERDLLVVLALAENRQMSREDLLHAVWRYRPDLETHTLETHVYRLRRKIEQQADKPEILLTTEGGYRLQISNIRKN